MPQLVTADVEDIKNLLGYQSPAVPVGYQTLLNKSLVLERTTQDITWIKKLITRCKKTFDESESDAQDSGVAYRRVITGDTNRSDIEYRSTSERDRRKSFIFETDTLARHMGIQNFSNPKNFHLLNLDTAFLH